MVFKPHLQYQKEEAQLARDPCIGCRDAASTHHRWKATRTETAHERVMSQEAIRMHGTWGRQRVPRVDDSEDGRMSWHPSSNPARDALRENYLTHWDFLKFGLQCREVAPTDKLKSEVGTWQKHGHRYIRLCHKQNEVRFSHFTHK